MYSAVAVIVQELSRDKEVLKAFTSFCVSILQQETVGESTEDLLKIAANAVLQDKEIAYRVSLYTCRHICALISTIF